MLLTATQSENIDTCLLQLKAILRKMGVVEYSFSDHYHHHSITDDAELDQPTISAFCEHINDLYIKTACTGL